MPEVSRLIVLVRRGGGRGGTQTSSGGEETGTVVDLVGSRGAKKGVNSPVSLDAAVELGAVGKAGRWEDGKGGGGRLWLFDVVKSSTSADCIALGRKGSGGLIDRSAEGVREGIGGLEREGGVGSNKISGEEDRRI